MQRRQFLSIAGTTALAAPFINMRPANAAEFNFKYACNVSNAHPLTRGVASVVARLREKTAGRVEIQMFPNNQLGSEADMLTQLRTGAIDFYHMSGLVLATLVPTAAINGVGFAFNSTSEAWRVMDGKLGAYVRQSIEGSRLGVLEHIWEGGFRHITSSTKPITTPADLKGFKIRVPVSPLWTSMFAAFGSAPVGINWGEVYTSLQTKVIDGQETPLVSIEAAKLYEVQKYCSLTRHMWDGFWLLTNPRVMRSLPDDIRRIIVDEFNAGALDQRQVSNTENTSMRGKLVEQGLIFNETDPTVFQAALRDAGFYKDCKEKFGTEAWKLLEDGIGRSLS